MTEKFGIYVHFPFCRAKCFYCDFYSVTGKEDLIDPYVGAVIREIEQRSKTFEGSKAVSIFFGGGTPSLIEPYNIEKIIDSIRTNLDLDVDAEVTMEMNPESVTQEKLNGYYEAGVNRVSLGVQSLNNAELKFLERIHTADEALSALDNVFKAGFTNVSVDMMYALPGQAMDGWLYGLREMTRLNINGVSCYEITPAKGTPFWLKIKEGDLILPGESEIFFDETESFLESVGFNHYEISNYAKEGFESVHNLGYWEYRDYLGVGAGAHTKLGAMRRENVLSIDTYIEHDGKCVKSEESLTGEMINTERLMLGLRLKKGIAIDKISITEKTRRMIADGFLEINQNYLRASRPGWRILDSVLARL